MKLKMGLLMVCLLVGSFVQSEEKMVTITQKEYQKLLKKQSYRLGLRGGLWFPSDAEKLDQNNAYSFELEFDAKLNENLDTGPRIGVSSLTVDTALSDAKYTVVMFGYGARVYLASFGRETSTHGLINVYGNGNAQFMIANKRDDSATTFTSPSNYAGLGVYGGTGVEMGIGRNTGVYGEVGYQTTKLKSSAGEQLPLNGFVLSSGLRLSFI